MPQGTNRGPWQKRQPAKTRQILETCRFVRRRKSRVSVPGKPVRTGRTTFHRDPPSQTAMSTGGLGTWTPCRRTIRGLARSPRTPGGSPRAHVARSVHKQTRGRGQLAPFLVSIERAPPISGEQTVADQGSGKQSGRWNAFRRHAGAGDADFKQDKETDIIEPSHASAPRASSLLGAGRERAIPTGSRRIS